MSDMGVSCALVVKMNEKSRYIDLYKCPDTHEYTSGDIRASGNLLFCLCCIIMRLVLRNITSCRKRTAVNNGSMTLRFDSKVTTNMTMGKRVTELQEFLYLLGAKIYCLSSYTIRERQGE